MIKINRSWWAKDYDIKLDHWVTYVYARTYNGREEDVLCVAYLGQGDEKTSLFCDRLVKAKYKTITGLKRGVAKRMKNFHKAIGLPA